MKGVVLLVCVLGLVASEEVARRYHQRVGIPAATAIRRQESMRLAGGLSSYLGEHPFLAGLVITLTTGDTSICGGALLSHTQVVTTGQCWWDGYSQAKSVLVVLGSIKLFSGGVRKVASTCTVHRLYDADNLQNDIAMLKISYVYYTSYIKPISLPTGINSTFVGSRAEAIGFGKTSDAAIVTNSQALRDVYLPVISNELCAETYGDIVTRNVMCTSGENSRGPCGGDSGGPLIMRYYSGDNDLLNVDNLTLRLCLECKANILKYFAFKKQVIEAHDILNKYLLKSSQSTSPKYSTTLITHQPDSTGLHQFHPLIKTDNDSERVWHVPLAFIKVEDALDDAADYDYFVDDGGSREGGDDKDFTAVLKPDLIAPNKLKLRVKNKNRKSQEEDFDASDEEPLKHKKNREADAGTGKRSKKRKKENDASPKVDRRKHPAPKKEKPPGVVDNQRVRNKLQRLNVAPGQLEMQVLSWEEVDAERQKALSSVTFTRHEHRCYDCALGFNHKFKLTNHLKKHEPSAGEFVCSVCHVRCKDTHSLCAHRRRHRVRWRCCACLATCSRADVAADHVAREHAAPAPTHVCRVCGHTAPSLAKLRNHMKNHGERQKCELCAKSFRDRSSLRTHLFIHAGSKEHACPRCDKRFLFKKAMEVHLVTHDAPAHLYCYECDLNFKNRMSFKQHMKYSLKHIDPAKLKYACSLCDKKFMKASRLEEHNLAVHLKATPISCTVPGCNFACASRPVLRTHVRMRHRGGRAVRNHVCDACGKAYMTKKTLEGHLRSHTGERPFQCAQCAATFGYEAALYNHNKLVHLNAKAGRARAAT